MSANTCSPCCGCQTHFHDDFEGGLTNFSAVSGSWSTAGSVGFKYANTSSTDALLICGTDAPDTTTLRLTTALNLMSNGAEARLVFDYVDSSNYSYAQWVRGASGYIALFNVSGGVHTEFGIRQTINYTTTTIAYLEVCVTEYGLVLGRVWGSASDSAASSLQGFAYGSEFTPSSTSWGIGTGTTGAGDVRFHDAWIYQRDASCVNCACGACLGVTVPTQYQVDISGMGAGCTGLNGTWYLDGQPGGCGTWFDTVSIGISSGRTITELRLISLSGITCADPLGRVMRLSVIFSGGSSAAWWESTAATSTCSETHCNFSGVSLPVNGVDCHTSATATITGIGG